MKWIRKKNNSELEKIYFEYNTIISDITGKSRSGQLEGGTSLKSYYEAVKNRARILTILNQRRHERNHRSGVNHGNIQV